MSYRIITDSCCDFPNEMYDKLGLTCVPLTLLFRGQSLQRFTEESLLDMYNGMRAGETASTSAINPDGWANAMESVLAAGEDVLVIAFSSGLSTTYQSAVIAAGELAEKYPQRKIRVVDSLCASMGQGLLVWYACRKQQEGLSLDELAQWCKDTKPHLCHWFTVDDLVYLKRGGRVSSATALLGTLLNIKPVLHVDDEGHLVNVSKVRGRKAAIEALAAKVGALGEGFDNSTAFISHGDCIEDARYLEKLLKQKYGVKDVVISYVGAVIGSHAGPGTLALFFLGKQR